MAHARVCLVAVVVLLCLPICAMAEEKKLYPACGGYEWRANAAATQEATLFSFSHAYQSLSLHCLAYEVVSVTGGQAEADKDYCLVEHQTEYNYSLMLRAVYTNSQGDSVSRDFSIRDMTGGSLAEVTARMPTASHFFIVFKNTGTNARCNLRIRALLSFTYDPLADTGVVAPTVVAIEPRTIYTKDSPRSYLVLDYGNMASSRRNDKVTLVDYTTGTCKHPSGGAIYMNYASTLPDSVHLLENLSSYSARSATFYEANTYRVCFQESGSNTVLQLAVLTAFSGNPTYFEIISGMDSEGRIMVGTEATIKFYGTSLDTRKNGDQAKFVWFTEECDSGAPSAGVPLAKDLGPEDNYGPETTYSLWTWRMTMGGSFKVCYRRAATGKWTEVPSLDDVGGGIPPDNATSTTSSTPVPTDPTTQQQCPVLTYNAAEPWKKYKSAQITLLTKDIPDDFLESLSHLLCLPPSVFTLTHKRENEDGTKDVFIALICNPTSSAVVCDMTERLNFLAQKPSSELDRYGIRKVACSTSMFAFDDDATMVVVRRSSTVIIFCSVCVLVGGGMAVFAVHRYTDRRHHFTQFGLDEDDIEDMYDFGAAPSSAMHNNHDVASAAPEAQETRIQNAVIEMEE